MASESKNSRRAAPPLGTGLGVSELSSALDAPLGSAENTVKGSGDAGPEARFSMEDRGSLGGGDGKRGFLFVASGSSTLVPPQRASILATRSSQSARDDVLAPSAQLLDLGIHVRIGVRGRGGDGEGRFLRCHLL